MPVQPLKPELRLLAPFSPELHLRQDLDGRLLAASPTVEAVLGYAPAELVGRPARELLHPADRDQVEHAVRSALAVSDTVSLRLRLLRRDGTLLKADVRWDAVRDAHGTIVEYRVTARDSTERRRDDELRAQWEVLFRVTRRGIAVTDAKTRLIVAVNPAYAAMHGASVEELVGRPITTLLTPEAAARIDELPARIDAEGFLSYDSEHVRPDGSTFAVGVEVMAARDDDGEQRYWLAWVEDLTERRQAEADAARHAGELARSNAELDRFAGVVSHDLQSPMRVIAGCARILERRAGDQLAPEERELVDHIVGGVHRMTALLDGIREWSRVRSEHAPMTDVDCGEVVREALSLLAADLDGAGATVDIGELPVVHGHPAALVQLFQNLIGNAVKFRADEPPRIEVAARRTGTVWQLTVTDNGVGIVPEQAERVFEFGARLHTDADVPGSGIGLTVCKTVVERHGGRIWVESAPGGGSRFAFTLPASRS